MELSQNLAFNTTQMMHNKTTDVTTLAQQYNDGMAEIMVKHTPIKTKKIKIKHYQPWFNDRLKSEIKLRRFKEKVWLCDPTEYNLQAFYNQRRFAANLAKSLEETYYHNLLHDNQHDYKEIFKLTNQLLFRNIMPPLPTGNSDSQLAMDFNEFFCDKINQIMVGLNTSTVKANMPTTLKMTLILSIGLTISNP